MGVKGLATHLKKIGGSREINVIHEIQCSGQEQPLIVVDLLTLIHSLSGPPKEQIFGHRNQNAWRNAAHFCDTMIAAGARLVFFIDGKLQESKYASWMQRQEQHYRDCLNVLNELAANTKRWPNVHGNVTKQAFTSALVAAARSKGVLIASYDDECDWAVASYANKHKALAVFTGDTDYLIYEGEWRLWSSSDLKLDTMQTCEWDKNLLRKDLKLDWNQMPFLAAIAGNDLISQRPPNLRSINAIAQRVNELQLTLKTTNICKELCKTIFGTENENVKNSFVNAVMLYDLDRTLITSLIPPEISHYPNCALHILLNIPGSIRLPYLDLRKAEYSHFALQIYQRQVGILLFRQNSNAKIFIKLDHFQPYKIQSVEPIKPPSSVHVPVPDDLYSLNDDIYAKLNVEKHILLCWLISSRLDVDKISHLDPKYLLDVLTLYFLVERKLITTETADIILIVIDRAIKQQIRLIWPSNPPSCENAETSFLYLNFYTQVYFCAEIVGLRKELDDVFLCKFDGVYFDAIADTMRRDPQSRKQALQPLEQYRLYSEGGSKRLLK